MKDANESELKSVGINALSKYLSRWEALIKLL